MFAADIVEAVVEVLDTGGDVGKGVLVGALNLAARANDHVELELDATVGRRRREPRGAARGGRRHEADLVVTSLVGDKVELAGRGTSLGHDAVVVVEDFLYGLPKRLGLALCLVTETKVRALRRGRAVKGVCGQPTSTVM